jgi:hypothetical protein
MKVLSCVIASTLLCAVAGLSLADQANNAAGKPVRAQVVGSDRNVYEGQLIRMFGCWYVQFDKPTRDGFQSVRLDEVTQLQLATKSGWTSASLAALRSRESASCFADGNG